MKFTVKISIQGITPVSNNWQIIAIIKAKPDPIPKPLPNVPLCSIFYLYFCTILIIVLRTKNTAHKYALSGWLYLRILPHYHKSCSAFLIFIPICLLNSIGISPRKPPRTCCHPVIFPCHNLEL